MSEKKSRLTVTIDPQLTAYAERLVATGKAPSVSAVFNAALEEKIHRERRIRARWKAAADQADQAKVARMMAHVERQVRQLGLLTGQ